MKGIGFRALSIFCIVMYASAAFSQNGWVKNSPGTNSDLVAVYFTSAETGWIAGDNGYLASTSDGGRTWKTYPLNTAEDINEIYFRNEKNGYLVAGRKMFITQDAGLSWRETVIYRPADFKNGVPEFLSIRFADKRRGLVVGSVLNRSGSVVDSLVMRTEDGGETWSRVVVPSKTELFHVDYDGSSRGWIVGDEGVILATVDGGTTWILQNSTTRLALFNVDFRDDDEGYAVGEKGLVLRTENGGLTWQKVITTTPFNFMRVNFADDKNGWIVGYGGTVLRSSDKGRTWIKQESSTTGHLYGLFVTKKFGWAVGAKGTILSYK
ncbi:MAG TPA: YCF48-related protein [Pyrinomonadaceae bacterium]|nr:YCF48-related protein [Pyrinomonadaceae bacterium]